MPSTKQPFWIEYTKPNPYTGIPEKHTRDLSVRRSRALRMWRMLRNTVEFKNATFHEPPARAEGLKRYKAQQAAHQASLERKAKLELSLVDAVRKATRPGPVVPDEMIDAYRDVLAMEVRSTETGSFRRK